MRLVINKGVTYYDLTKEAKDKIIKDLTIENPKYNDALKNGRYIGMDTPSHLHFFAVSEDRSVFWTPAGYIWYFKRWLWQNDIKHTVQDNSTVSDKRNFYFHGTLRPYQREAVLEVTSRYPVSTLEAATGAGKTVMGCGIIARRNQTTLIIVHNKELLYQWQGAIKKFLDYDVGLIGDGKYDVKDITVGIVNTVRNKTHLLCDSFGQIIIDECHRTASTTFIETLPKFSAKFQLGLSATPFRRDGLGCAINAYIGPKLHKVDKKKLHELGAVLKPVIYRVQTMFNFMYKGDYSTMIKALCDNNERNKLISDTVCADLKRYNENVLIVSDRVTHCEKIAIELESRGISSAILHGGLTNKKRKKIVKDIRAGKRKVLIATISLIGEGFDAPKLSSIFLTTPIKFEGRLLQVIGRILRPEKNKIPRVFDFRDPDVFVLCSSGFNRDKIYKKEWA